jgi:DNA-binding NarL/FixJ family response regulator
MDTSSIFERGFISMNRNVQEIVEEVQTQATQLQDSVLQWVDQAKPKALEAVQKSKDAVRYAVDHLPENSNKIIAYTAAGLAVGIIGYKLGKVRRKDPVIEQATLASAKFAAQLSPVFKFLKLWMIYRISV